MMTTGAAGKCELNEQEKNRLCSVIILWKATEQYFHVVLFVL